MAGRSEAASLCRKRIKIGYACRSGVDKNSRRLARRSQAHGQALTEIDLMQELNGNRQRPVKCAKLAERKGKQGGEVTPNRTLLREGDEPITVERT